jgi:hypothetical protein
MEPPADGDAGETEAAAGTIPGIGGSGCEFSGS